MAIAGRHDGTMALDCPPKKFRFSSGKTSVNCDAFKHLYPELQPQGT